MRVIEWRSLMGGIISTATAFFVGYPFLFCAVHGYSAQGWPVLRAPTPAHWSRYVAALDVAHCAAVWRGMWHGQSEAFERGGRVEVLIAIASSCALSVLAANVDDVRLPVLGWAAAMPAACWAIMLTMGGVA